MVAVSHDTDDSAVVDELHQLALEYAEARRRSAVAWQYVQQPRDGELQYATFRYLPEHHFRRAYDRLTIQEELEPDGGHDILHKGTRRTTVYYWLDPATGAALYHTGAYDDEADPFFDSMEEAETFLEQQADQGEAADRYEAASLYKARTRKVEDAKDVLLDQAGIDEFGGTE